MHIITFLIILCLCLTNTCEGLIDKVKNLDEVFARFKNADQSSLGVFVIDKVLIEPSDPAFQSANIRKYQAIADKILKDIPKDKQPLFWALADNETEYLLADPKIPEHLTALTRNGIPSIGVTSSITGKFESIANMENFMIQRLLKLGLNFARGAHLQQDIVLKRIPAYRGNYAMYKSGVVFANGIPTRADALSSVFQTSAIYPKKIIYVDYQVDNLKTLEKSLLQIDRSIEFIGLLFEGLNTPSKPISEAQFKTRWQQLAAKAKSAQ